MTERDEIRLAFAKMTLDWLRESGHAEAINEDGTVSVFHGTSKKNAASIRATNRFEGYPFFAVDRETAERYSRQVGGPTEVLSLRVDPAVVIPTNGYMSARVSGLHLREDGSWSADEEAPDLQAPSPAP